MGCHPWLMDPDSGRRLSRALTQDARWMQRWGRGNRMRLFVTPIRPGGWFEGVTTRVSVRLDGELVLVDHELPLAAERNQSNPTTLLKLDAPEGVSEGDLVRVELLFNQAFSPVLIRDPSRAEVSVSMRAPAFRYVAP